jgi:hypothetical protein
MSKYLTIAISETYRNSNRFKIVYFDLSTNTFAEKDISEKEFFEPNGKPVWDLLHVTEVKDGQARLVVAYSKNKVVDLFKKNEISVEKFYKSSLKYGIVKLSRIKEVKPLDENFQTRIVLRSRGEDRYLLNKDYRWVKYWLSLNKELYDEKSEQWKDFLNNNEVYAVMYRHVFKKNGSIGRWIAGIHSIKEEKV